MEFDHEKYVLRYAYLFVSPLSFVYCCVVLYCIVLTFPAILFIYVHINI